MTGTIVRVWLDDVVPGRIHFLAVQRNGRARRAYADPGSTLHTYLLRRLP